MWSRKQSHSDDCPACGKSWSRSSRRLSLRSPAERRLWVNRVASAMSPAGPLYPHEPTSSVRSTRSEKCHKRTHAPQYRLSLCRPSNRGRRHGSLIAAVFFGPALCGPGHFDDLRSTSMAVMSRSISPQSRITRRHAPGGLASHGRPRNAVSPIRNCQNSRMARDLLRKVPADNTGPEPRHLRRRHAVRLRASRRANRQSLRPRQRQQMSSSF
jgi:hypothetical protein